VALVSAPRFGATPSRPTRNVILIVIGVLFLVPILAMIEFTLEIGQPVKGVQQYGIQHYLDVFNPANESTYDGLFQGVQNSLVIALFTVIIILVLLLPTMILIELKFPRFRKLLEFICLIPITIPTVVLVVGFIPAYQAVAQIFGSTPYTLAFAIGIICHLPPVRVPTDRDEPGRGRGDYAQRGSAFARCQLDSGHGAGHPAEPPAGHPVGDPAHGGGGTW
jgi:putative spermidine/putrescine transport system permease protein